MAIKPIWILLLSLQCLWKTGGADEGWFWHVTDFHYDFTYHDRQLSCNSQVDNPGQFGDYWCDSPWRLVNDSISDMANIKGSVDFILWTGDTVLHGRDADLSYQTNSDILDNVTQVMSKAFPGKPVYATFGNHDYYPTDQFPPHNNELYNDTLLRWSNWIMEPTQNSNFRKGGYYTTKTTHGIRIVALNTNLYYTSNKQVINESDPADQFQWLNMTLSRAEHSQEKVIVTAHIPPGVHTPNGLVWMYEKFNTKLVEILQRYASIIVGLHFGHDHADGFKILPDSHGTPKAPIFIAPSVTPWRYKIPSQIGPAHNPGIRLIKYDRTTGTHLDIEQYYLDLPKANRNGAAIWELEYKTSTNYKLSQLTGTSLHGLTQKLKNSKSAEFANYWKYYTVSTAGSLLGECTGTCHASIYCGFTKFHLNEFKDCAQQVVSGSQTLQSAISTVIFCVSVPWNLFLKLYF